MNKYSVVCSEHRVEMIVPNGGIGIYILETASFGPYQLWVGDMHACPICDRRVVIGFADRPLAEHWQPDFEEKVSVAQASGMIELEPH